MNEPAFPTDSHEYNYQGMTLRDYFAAKAMQALIASPRSPAPVRDGQDITAQIISELAYVTADAMMEARNVAQ